VTHQLAAMLLAAAAVVCMRGSDSARVRLRRIVRGERGRPEPVRKRCDTSRGLPIRVVAILVGAAITWAVGGWGGCIAGVAAAIAFDRGVRHLEPASDRRSRESAEAALPLTGELLAAAVIAGSTVDGAVRAVASAVGGSLGHRLAQVGNALALGADPVDAWAPLADLPDAAPMVQAAIRGSASGAAWSGAIRRAVDGVRATAAAAEEARAGRASVLLVLPVGLCFLPAFVLIGVVPVVVGVLATALP
jgi:pilus assembly protein TadC